MSNSTNAPAPANTALPMPADLPAWYEEYLLVYSSGEAHGFVLAGDANAYAFQAVTHRNTLIASLMDKRQVVVVYDRAIGIMFPDDNEQAAKSLKRMRTRATALLGTTAARSVALPAADYGAVALGAAGSTPAQQSDPFRVSSVGAALQVLEQLLLAPDAKDQVAVVIQGADLICPQVDKGIMSDEDRDVLARLRSWGSRRDIGDQNNPIFLLTNTLTDLHVDLRAASSGYYTLRIPMPDRATRLAYLQWYMAWREAGHQPIGLLDVTLPELASMTGGLTLRGVEDILLRGARMGGVAPAFVRQRKDQIITTEYTKVARMLDPLSGGFRTFSGRDDIKQWSRAELIAPIQEGRLAHAIKGVLFVGPPGCGKTFFARALAAELGGWNVVAFRPEKIEEGLVGSSERNMEMFWDFCIALSPTLILFDEIDQTNVSRRGTNSGNPVAGNLFNQMLDRMSDETLRGRIVGLFASNRPDLIDPALLRFGRMDAILPFLLPEIDERRGVLLSQAAMQGVTIEEAALARLTDGTAGATQSDLAAYIAKARRLAERRGSDAITVAEADLALRYIRPTSPAVSEFYTLLAINACTDSEFLPEQYARKLDERQRLADEIEQAADRAQMPIPTPRRARSW